MTTILKVQSKSYFIVRFLLISFIWLALSSCNKKIYFSTSTVEPAAIGTVRIKKDRNHNFSLELDVKNLAAPNRLPEPRNVYVVWIETEANGVQNLGQLNTSTGLITSTLKAFMHSTTPYKPTRLFITAEDAPTVSTPGNYVVLTTGSL